jgi:F-type H+-transporting ATPase subunit gamma
MPNLKEVRTRIESVKSTQQITSAMKMVAASKLRKAQNAIIKLRPYASKLHEILQNLSKSIEDSEEHVYSEVREPENILLIIIASNRGLCGAFNANVIKTANNLIEKKYNKQFKSGNLSIFCFGKKISDYYSKEEYKITETNNEIFDNLTFDNVAPIAENLMKDFADEKYDRIEIIFNHFINAAVQRLVSVQYLPIVPETQSGSHQHELNADFIFEPNKEEILKELIPKSLKIQLYKAILDSFVSEQGARMTAMHQATDNAQEILKNLKLSYNKARQAAITNEILEIVSGANALNE